MENFVRQHYINHRLAWLGRTPQRLAKMSIPRGKVCEMGIDFRYISRYPVAINARNEAGIENQPRSF
jgi:hypothetical protein